jgi:threonine synthase
VTLATAHPAKFAGAVIRACGHEPRLPDGFDDVMSREENFTVLSNQQSAIEEFIRARARAVVEKV